MDDNLQMDQSYILLCSVANSVLFWIRIESCIDIQWYRDLFVQSIKIEKPTVPIVPILINKEEAPESSADVVDEVAVVVISEVELVWEVSAVVVSEETGAQTRVSEGWHANASPTVALST